MQSLVTLVALGLVAYRATQLVVHDTIGDPVRARIEMWHADRFESRFRTFVRDLLSCTYCAGFWISCAVTGAWLWAAGEWGSASVWVHVFEAWAVAGVQALTNRWDDTRAGD